MYEKRSVVVMLAVALLCSSALAANANDWIAVHSASSQKADVRLISQTKGGLTIAASLSGLEKGILPAEMTGAKGEVFAALTIPGYAFTGELGKPKLPMITAVLDAPIGAEVSVNVVDGTYREYQLADLGIGQRIVPALPSVPKLEGAKPRFVLDAATYATDAMYPGKLAETDDQSKAGGLARGHRLVTIQLFPVQYNPASGMVRIYSDIRADVRFSGGDYAQSARAVRQDYSRDWETFIQRMTVNYDPALYGAKDSLLNLPVYYDIYYGSSFGAAAQRLANWKMKKGYKVRINDAGGWTAGRINDSIRLRSPKATYVAIISDPNATLAADQLPPSATGTSSADQTDLYYAETNESGYLPDLFNARISVQTAADANTVIDKLINYEHASFGTAGTAWIKKAALVSGYDGSYQPVCIATNEYCRQILAREGYTTIDTVILGSSEGKARIVARVNDGRAWTIYSAHGGQNCWCTSPYWYATELNGDLTNQDKYTFPIGHCCLAGDYQYTEDCFAETWPKLQNKGSVTYFGSVPSTYWDEDDWLQRRYFDAIYDSITNVPNTHINEAGRFTQYGLYWIENHTSTTRKQYYFEAYHVFNDPSMDFWTDEPHALTVTHNPFIPPSAGTFSVQVDESAVPLQNALVCLWSKAQPTMHLAGYTDASGSITLPANPSVANDTMWVTVTKHNFVPYEGYAIVRANGAYVTKLRHSTDDAAGNGDGIVNPGETVRLPTWVKNVGTNPTNGQVVSRLRSASPYVTLLDTAYTYPALAAGDSAQYAAGYQLTASPACTNGVALPLVLACHDNDSAWTTNFSVAVGTAVLAYNGRTIGGNGRLDPNETATMAVALKNNGLGYSYATQAVLRCSEPLVTVTDSTAAYGTINPSASGTSGADSFTLNIGAVPVGTSVGFTLVMKAAGAADRSYSWTETVGDLRYAVTPDNSTPVYYAAEDSDGVSRAPVYQWAEIRGVGTALSALLADDAYASITLPFTFRWYGASYTALTACSNGWISFGSNTSNAYSNTAIPTSAFTTPTVFAVWDDLNGLASAAPGAWVGYYNDAANHRLIVEYDSIVFYGTTNRLKFQVIYYDSTAGSPYYDVVLQYAICNPGTSSSVGFQQNGTVGAQLLFDGAYATTMLPLGNSRAIRLTRYPNGASGVTAPPAAAALPLDYQLGRAYPNPARGPVTISFALPRPVTAEVAVYNLMGQKVRTLAQGAQTAGYHTVTWDGTAGDGRQAAGGIYFYRLVTPDHRETRRLVYLR